MKRIYKDFVFTRQQGSSVTIFFGTKRIVGFVSREEAGAFLEATGLYNDMIAKLGKKNLKDICDLEESLTPAGVAAWVGSFVLGSKFLEKNNMKNSDIILIEKDVKIGSIILEKGDKIRVLKEDSWDWVMVRKKTNWEMWKTNTSINFDNFENPDDSFSLDAPENSFSLYSGRKDRQGSYFFDTDVNNQTISLKINFKPERSGYFIFMIDHKPIVLTPEELLEKMNKENWIYSGGFLN